MYKILRSILFLFDAEDVHYFSMNILKFLCKFQFIKNWITKKYTPVNKSSLELSSPLGELVGPFKNPVGLGAGFDKNARYLNELEALGFGFVEIGTVTPLPQKGNEKPRLFRLPKDKALINRMGFNNDGADAIAERLKRWKTRTDDRRQSTDGDNRRQTTVYRPQTTAATRNPKPATLPLIIGGNIGKNKNTSNENAWKDYEICFNALHPVCLIAPCTLLPCALQCCNLFVAAFL